MQVLCILIYTKGCEECLQAHTHSHIYTLELSSSSTVEHHGVNYMHWNSWTVPECRHFYICIHFHFTSAASCVSLWYWGIWVCCLARGCGGNTYLRSQTSSYADRFSQLEQDFKLGNVTSRLLSRPQATTVPPFIHWLIYLFWMHDGTLTRSHLFLTDTVPLIQ